jgi:hypothetical protein
MRSEKFLAREHMVCKSLLLASVKKAINTETGDAVAIKILDKEKVK